MAGTKNGTFYGAGYNVWPTDASDLVTMQLTTDSTQIINVSGTPEGSENGNPGSVALDRTNGTAYLKVTGTGNTGWQQIATGTDVPQQFNGNTGSAVPVAGVRNVTGSGTISVAASGNTLSITDSGGGNVVGTPPSTDHAIARYDGASGLLIQNSVPTIDDTGNLSIAASVSGATLSSTISNTSNTASSNATQFVTVAGTSAGDALTQYAVAGTTTWSMGIDNSNSDGFTYSASATLGTTNIFQFGTEGNFAAQGQTSGAGNTFIYSNINNTASSAASMQVQVAGTSAGDPTNVWTVSGANYFTAGIDNSDSDSFKINFNSVNLGTNDAFVMTTAGEITKPLQPAFLAFLGTSDLNVTGNATAFTLGSGNALTEVFDQGSDFVTTGTFTAPVTGRYFFACGFYVAQLDATMTYGRVQFATSNRNYGLGFVNCGASRTVATASDLYAWNNSVFADMDAADTCTVNIFISGAAGNTADVTALGANTFFSGYLAC